MHGESMCLVSQCVHVHASVCSKQISVNASGVLQTSCCLCAPVD